MTRHEATIRALVGSDLFARALPYVRGGAVSQLVVSGDGNSIFGLVHGTERQPYSTRVILNEEPGGELVDFIGTCSCPVGDDCKHAVALMLAAGGEDDRYGDVEPADAAGWQARFDSLLSGVRPGEDAGDKQPVALQFEVLGREPNFSLTMRPVAPGANGNWIKTGISWANLYPVRYARTPQAIRQHRLLTELLALHDAAQPYGSYYGRTPTALGLGNFDTPRVWDVLADALDSGIPFVPARRTDGPVVLHRDPVEVALDLRDDEDGVHVAPRLRFQDADLEPAARFVLGAPAHGMGWWDVDAPGRTLHLARFGTTGQVDARELIKLGPVRVPPQDRARFLTEYVLPLQDAVPVLSSNSSLVLPEQSRPVLHLDLVHRVGRLGLSWSWRYGEGEATLRAPLSSSGAVSRLRDVDAEREILDRVRGICTALPSLVTPNGLCDDAVLAGFDVVTFAGEVQPALAELAEVNIELTGDPLSYAEAAEPPEIEFRAADEQTGRDWLDLAVTVRVDGRVLSFEELFRALAVGAKVMILPDGTWFDIDRPEFDRLAELIAESRELYDGSGQSVRVSRYQASMWEDLEEIGAVRGELADWHAALRGLMAAAEDDSAPPTPATLKAELRPYQQVGYGWLAHLYEHGLGGVLADEMGLGKTIQCLALFLRARELDPDSPPFLVVAPTSVVSNWASEAERFAPDLRVVAVTETARRRGTPVAELAAGADVVITSYALFRIDNADYTAAQWSGLVLDEAQFVKNHRSQAFLCAKKLVAPFKLAITGTPMENNLTELWAMFAITAPGLFPSARAFEQYFRIPIERNHHPELLARLRRRVRPFMLRRTKGEVIADLPDKQEQVLELDLNPRHKKAYQTFLQRERRKVFGLLTDLDRNQFEILRSLTLLRQAALDVSLVDDTQSAPSTKLDEALAMLTEIAAEGHRVVVFSQFTRFLTKVRDGLGAAGIDCAYLDGRTKNRAKVINGFKAGTAPVFLISLKAGGFGLNLTEADYCILLDPWWNPATEAQAVDRVHRIGQTNKVTVYRLVARDTIEQKVMALKTGKAELFASVMDSGDWRGGRLTPDEIRELLD